ncbi:hypothetical protein CSW62_06395 [Caulobacter sp. FWC2]|nr:hypothetical protein CSW62_06395 [Caulobacter sp. FWC2]
MIAASKTRWVQVLIGENHWKDAVISQLETGDVFRLAEPNGTLAHGGKIYVVRQAPQVIAQEWPAEGDAAVVAFGANAEPRKAE